MIFNKFTWWVSVIRNIYPAIYWRVESCWHTTHQLINSYHSYRTELAGKSILKRLVDLFNLKHWNQLLSMMGDRIDSNITACNMYDIGENWIKCIYFLEGCWVQLLWTLFINCLNNFIIYLLIYNFCFAGEYLKLCTSVLNVGELFNFYFAFELLYQHL